MPELLAYGEDRVIINHDSENAFKFTEFMTVCAISVRFLV